MSTTTEVEMCIPCLNKLHEHIIKAQEEYRKSQEKVEKQETQAEKESQQVEQSCNMGEYERASPEEIERCFASLSYAIPICDFCKAQKNFCIVKLPMNAFQIQ